MRLRFDRLPANEKGDRLQIGKLFPIQDFLLINFTSQMKLVRSVLRLPLPHGLSETRGWGRSAG